MKMECYGCGKSFDEQQEGICRVGIKISRQHENEFSGETYCRICSQKVEGLDKGALHDKVQELVKNSILKPSRTTVSISESLVREIAHNLGASYRLADALVERIFGPNWTGAPPEDSGLVMNKFSNRDRLVAFVAAKLKDLWTLEA